MKKRGTGIAAALYPTGASKGGDVSEAIARVNSDGSAEVFFGTTDLGQGIQTIAAQVTAEELGIPYNQVRVCNRDTDVAPFSTGAVASRAAYSDSIAISAAAREARDILFSAASSKFEVNKEDIDCKEGVIYCKKEPGKHLTIGEVANYAIHTLGIMVVGHGSFIGELSSPDPETGACNPFRTLAWCAMIAEVEVDTDTGEIKVLKLVSAYDVGKILHKGMVKGQIVGGAIMGIGAALMEHLYPYYPKLDWGTRSLSEYVLPTAVDIPAIDVEILECPSVDNVYGVKGVGEMTANVPSPAIVNAIHDAIGVWFNEIPVTAECVLRALEIKGGKK